MSDARELILARLQQGRRQPPATPADAPSAGASDSHTDTGLQRFRQGLEKVSASHVTVRTEQQISGAIEDYMQQLDEEQDLLVAPAITNAGLLANSALKLHPAPTRGDEKNLLTLAYAGIAETGSLVMLSSADTPMSSNFLPDNFICLLKTRDILSNMEVLWSRMDDEQRAMPRAVNIITGPSRTADVEQIIQLGAHGPRRVHVILWDESA